MLIAKHACTYTNGKKTQATVVVEIMATSYFTRKGAAIKQQDNYDTKPRVNRTRS